MLNYKWLLTILSGILLGIGFVVPFLKFLCWIALIPLLFFIESENVKKKIFLAGAIAGFLYFGQVLIWFFQTWPLDWAGIENCFFGFLIVFLFWFISVLFLSLFLGFFSLSYWFLKRENLFMIFLIPSLWVVFEYLRSWGFAIFSLGNASLIGPHWTWGSLGYLLTGNQILRNFANFGGVYLLSFIIVFVNAIFYFLFKGLFQNQKFKATKISLIIILFFLILFSYKVDLRKPENSQMPLKVAILQTDFSSFFYLKEEERIKRLDIKKDLIKEAVKENPDIIIFPEDSRFLAFVEKDFLEGLNKKQILIIDSARTETPQGTKSIITFFDTQKGPLAFQEKLFLAPLGEYLPYILKVPAQIFNQNWVEKFEKSRGYKKGKEISIASFLDIKIGGFLCSEILSSNLYRKMAKNSEIIFNLGSHGASHGSRILNSQIEAMAQIRAIENGKYLIRATNQGLSYIIDDKGNFIQKTEKIGNQILFGKVYPKKEKTLYNKFGDWILIFAFGMVLAILIKNKGATSLKQKFI